MIEFEERTIKIIIDDSKCRDCKSHACAEACKTYDRGILVIKDAEFTKRVGTECLACEYECWFRGNNAITIEVPIAGLDEYRRKHGLT
jgi:hypothetical protein